MGGVINKMAGGDELNKTIQRVGQSLRNVLRIIDMLLRNMLFRLITQELLKF